MMKKTILISLTILMTLGVYAQRKAVRSASSSVEPGYYRIRTAANQTKYIDVPGYGLEAKNKDYHLQLWDMDNGWDRIIQVIPAGDGYFKLSPAHSTHVFDIEGGEGATKNGAKLQLWDDKRQTNQAFKFVKAPGEDTYYIKARHSGKYLDAIDADIHSNGCAIQQWSYTGKIDQRWVLEPYHGYVDKIYTGSFYIKNAYSSKYWDVAGYGSATNQNSKTVQIWEMDSGSDRRVKFIPSGDKNYFYIKFQNGGRCADIQGRSYRNGGDLVIYDCKGGDNQKFRFDHVGNDRYVIIAKHSNKAIDVSGGTSEIHKNGPDLHQWDIHKGKSQQWKLIHADGSKRNQQFRGAKVSGPQPLSN